MTVHVSWAKELVNPIDSIKTLGTIYVSKSALNHLMTSVSTSATWNKAFEAPNVIDF